jgi:hypothetical protein
LLRRHAGHGLLHSRSLLAGGSRHRAHATGATLGFGPFCGDQSQSGDHRSGEDEALHVEILLERLITTDMR